MSERTPPTYAYGITTVPVRRFTTLPHTLRSLSAGGFHIPRLFVDTPMRKDHELYEDIKLDATFRYPPLGIHGNWILSLYELYLREPLVDRYAIFQDDTICYRNLRKYLDRCPLASNQCWNLYTFPPGTQTAPPPPEPSGGNLSPQRASWCGPVGSGWFLSNQLGRGACALVFPRDAVKRILSHRHIIDKGENVQRRNTIDGAISEVIRDLKITEYVHDPSLVQHIGTISSVNHPTYPACWTFLGESFDALNLL